MSIGLINTTFQNNSDVFIGAAAVSGYVLVPVGAKKLTVSLIAPGGDGGAGNTGGSTGGGGGGAGGACFAEFNLSNTDANTSIFYNVGWREGENSFITTSLETYGAVSILCSSGHDGLDDLSGGTGGNGGTGTGDASVYTGGSGFDGEPVADTGFGGFGGIPAYYFGSNTSAGKGGRGGNNPSNTGRTNGKTGLIAFIWE